MVKSGAICAPSRPVNLRSSISSLWANCFWTIKYIDFGGWLVSVSFLSIGELRWNGMFAKTLYGVVGSSVLKKSSFLIVTFWCLDRFCLSVGSKRVSGS